jgi:hypothetical protein
MMSGSMDDCDMDDSQAERDDASMSPTAADAAAVLLHVGAGGMPADAAAIAAEKQRQRRKAAARNKRQRLVFSDIQKRTLQAIFKETQRPSREMQHTIAEHLQVCPSLVYAVYEQ